MTTDLAARATTLLELHRPGRPLVLVNAWDAGSARVVAAAGAPAIATGSAGVAAFLGRPDGQRLSRDEMLAAVRSVASAVPLPVTADMEAGYGATPADVAETAGRVLAAGAVGINLEDVDPAGAPDTLVDLDDQLARIRAVRERADHEGVHLVLNARCDVYLARVGDAGARLGTAVERANAYLGAGADCAFIPGVTEAQTIAALVAGIHGPVNVLAAPGSPPVAELAALGVARVSVGSWPARAAITLLSRIAHEVLDNGTYDALGGALSYAEVQRLFAT
ncbi:MAG TPA: isocitrate lyase/phosphoenolpyruvate mutase family protein [Candidatus Dormibacteraeota bacterium]|nr:isocitrate lyase/phosphoenolpyruvate mutase family protein [Candidatus Dormibacteraeota bacterium]